jgi:hypothetical protein
MNIDPVETLQRNVRTLPETGVPARHTECEQPSRLNRMKSHPKTYFRHFGSVGVTKGQRTQGSLPFALYFVPIQR